MEIHRIYFSRALSNWILAKRNDRGEEEFAQFSYDPAKCFSHIDGSDGSGEKIFVVISSNIEDKHEVRIPSLDPYQDNAQGRASRDALYAYSKSLKELGHINQSNAIKEVVDKAEDMILEKLR